jgi:chorismate mutase / prephenate dehydratase
MADRVRMKKKAASSKSSKPAGTPGALPLLASGKPVDLAAIRQEIDSIDARIHTLLNDRARLAQQVGISKTAGGRAVDFYRPEREADVLRKALERNHGPLRDEEIARLFREIMSACLAQQEPLKVAFLGPEGTFTQAAVQKHFGSSVRALPLPAIDEVFREVEGGIADFGVVPIENSTEGTVNHTLDMFLRSALKICGEVELRIHHHLMGRMAGLADVKRVCAHPQALAQCRGWLDEHLSDIERIAASSNAEGARRARDERGTAAIASRAAAEIYGLSLLADEIEDRSDNTPRFLVIGRKLFSPSGADRTTLLVSASGTDDPGALFRLLEPFAEHRINMTRIESRPSHKRKWDYVFFMDVEGHVSDVPLAKALASLEKRASLFKVLGSYPRAVL